MRTKLLAIVRPCELASASERARVVRPGASVLTSAFRDSRTVPRPVLDGATREDRATQLFELLLAELIEGRPTLCTYKAAVTITLGYPKYTPAYGSQLTKLASRTGTFEIEGLGEIRLDTFLVNRTRQPGDKHWDCATYSRSEWERAFASAMVIE